MKILETERLILRTFSENDIDSMVVINQDPQVCKFLPGIGNRQTTEAIVRNIITQYQQHGFSLYAVELKSTKEFIGWTGLFIPAFEAHFTPAIEIGWRLASQHWNQGFATEAAHVVLDYAFNRLNLNEVVSFTVPENKASRRVMEKIGLHYNPTDDFDHPRLALDSPLCRHVLYRLTKIEYLTTCLVKTHHNNYYILTGGPGAGKTSVLNESKNRGYVDHAKFSLIPATLETYPIIQNMARFYVYDMSEDLGFEPGWEIPENGLYESIDFKKYWEKKDAFPFLISYEQELVGFVIVDKKGSDTSIDFNMAQFFILKKFQNKGVGRNIAHQCFKQFPGRWEVMIIPGNHGAYRFWHSVISRYTQDNFIEYSRRIAHFNNNTKDVFCFNSQVNTEKAQ